jgi:hypothetical protein
MKKCPDCYMESKELSPDAIAAFINPKSKESWPIGPGFDYPQREFALLTVH